MTSTRTFLALALAVCAVCAVCAAPGGLLANAAEDAAPAAAQTAAAAAQQPQQQTVTAAQAVALLAQQAEQGNAQALVALGAIYQQGRLMQQDYAKAFEYFTKAAAAGSSEGYYNTGVCYEVGMGTTGSADPANAGLAFQNFEKAAELGLSQGLYKLAGVYMAGAGTEKNEIWGVELLGRAAAAGHAAAANDLGVICFAGNFNQPKDTVKSYEWFMKSADLGNGEAMVNLAVFHREGIDRPADPAQELKWYALARVAGYPIAQIAPVVKQAEEKVTEEDVAKIEAEAAAWVKAFQERQQAKQQVRPEGNAAAAQ